MSKIKYGIIGLGWFGEYHGDALAGLPNVELYALCTRTESRLRELGEKFGVKHLYTDYNEMLPNTLYVEGSTLTRLLMGQAGLQKVRANRILTLVDKGARRYNEEIRKAVSTARVDITRSLPH